MTDPLPDDPARPDEPILVEPAEPMEADVAFVVPPSGYESIDTEEDLVVSASGGATVLAPASVDLAPVIDAVAALGRKLDAMQGQFDREVRAESTREKTVDRLHAELQEYKSDLLLKVLRPVFVDLIQLHDDIGKMSATLAPSLAEADANRVVGVLSGIGQGIEDILYRQGVEPFEQPGTEFDPKRQRAVSTTPTDDPALARSVAARLRKGFASQDKVIRPEVVSVFTVRKP